MLNETNSELEERLDSAAIEEMQARSGIQMPEPLYRACYDKTFKVMREGYFNYLIGEQQRIEAEEWNRHSYGY